jgi:hypothetical protein
MNVIEGLRARAKMAARGFKTAANTPMVNRLQLLHDHVLVCWEPTSSGGRDDGQNHHSLTDTLGNLSVMPLNPWPVGTESET